MQLVGLSLSFCIADMIVGTVAPEDVRFISTGTKAGTPEHWAQVLDDYCEIYWSKDPTKARELAEFFMNEGRLLQPRLEDQQPIRYVLEPVQYKGAWLGTHWKAAA